MSTMTAARARMVMKKKMSFLTTGPMRAISVLLLGMMRASESSWRPVMVSWTTTTMRMTVVI